MHLEWSDYPGIVQALKCWYPERNMSALGESELVELVRTLPSFRDDPTGPSDQQALWAIQSALSRLSAPAAVVPCQERECA